VSAMISNAEGEMAVIEPEKQKSKKGYTNSGHLVAGGAHIEHRPTLTQVNLKHSGVCRMRLGVCAVCHLHTVAQLCSVLRTTSGVSCNHCLCYLPVTLAYPVLCSSWLAAARSP
jgi:hypothetical protein